MSNEFGQWWKDVGSGITPLQDDDMENHAKRVAEATWNYAIELLDNQFSIYLTEPYRLPVKSRLAVCGFYDHLKKKMKAIRNNACAANFKRLSYGQTHEV